MVRHPRSLLYGLYVTFHFLVDRILRQQKEQREAEEKAIKLEQEKRKSEMELRQQLTPVASAPAPAPPVSRPSAPPVAPGPLVPAPAPTPLPNLFNANPSSESDTRGPREDMKTDGAQDLRRQSTVMSSLQNLRQKIVKRNETPSTDSRPASQLSLDSDRTLGPSSQASNTLQPPAHTSTVSRSPTPTPSSTVTPLSNIGMLCYVYTRSSMSLIFLRLMISFQH